MGYGSSAYCFDDAYPARALVASSAVSIGGLGASDRAFMATCLLVIVGQALLTAWAGLSMGLGAFVAGLLLAETEFRREIEVTIEPFKGLLLGLFRFYRRRFRYCRCSL